MVSGKYKYWMSWSYITVYKGVFYTSRMIIVKKPRQKPRTSSCCRTNFAA